MTTPVPSWPKVLPARLGVLYHPAYVASQAAKLNINDWCRRALVRYLDHELPGSPICIQSMMPDEYESVDAAIMAFENEGVPAPHIHFDVIIVKLDGVLRIKLLERAALERCNYSDIIHAAVTAELVADME